ncbi:MAG TPA: PLP-dependent transferase [Dermatophilaceae bacterium]|nr:PLP-dependent transferase [Dermatophilaceae bacterium]
MSERRHHDLPPGLSPATIAVAAGRPRREPGAPVNVPVTHSSTYAASAGHTAYGRNGNPTWTAFEEALGALEGGTALVFGSGMAAVSAALSLVPAGPVVAPLACYNMTSALLDDAAEAGRDVRRVDLADPDAASRALDGATLLWIETPTNPLMEVADLPALVRAAHERGALVAVDNTFATPLLQRPLEHGADVVVHSATKYLAGHSDVVLGAAVTGGDEAGQALHDRLLRHRIRHGAIAGPQETWLALRGLRTLALRVERAGANAAELARRLAEHPAVERVRYPGWGAMLAIEVRGGAAAADAVTAACRLWLDATSLGGVESLLERRRKYAAESPAVPESLLRLSVGIEDVEDLWRDLDQALGSTVAPD